MFLFGSYSLILIAIAVIPAIFLIVYIYREDRLEKESPRLVLMLVVLGIVSTFLAALAERIGFAILGAVLDENSLLGRIIMYFGIVAFAEEGFKYLVLKKATWKNPEFNCKFDGVVYAVAVSLGFALWENIQYVIAYGFPTALIRAVTAVPGHACFGVLMGVWYGLAKRKEAQGWDSAARLARTLAVIVPAIVHGAYDFIATANISTIHFVVFVILMFVVCFYTVRRASQDDRYHEE